MDTSLRGTPRRIWFTLLLPLVALSTFCASASAALAPTCSVAIDTLSPPNHKFVNVGLRVANASSWWISGVYQDEPLNANGDGNFEPDAKTCTCRHELLLRAERQGPGDGRVYLVTVMAYDSAHVLYTMRCTVVVPHDGSHASTDHVHAEAATYRANPNAMSPNYNSFGPGGIMSSNG
jgi:hypothetical protein